MKTKPKTREELLAGAVSFDARLKRDLKDREFLEAFKAHYLEAKIAEKLHALREKQHVTQRQLADRLGVRQHAISRIEKARNSMTVRTVQRIAAALGYEVVVNFKPARHVSAHVR